MKIDNENDPSKVESEGELEGKWDAFRICALVELYKQSDDIAPMTLLNQIRLVLAASPLEHGEDSPEPDYQAAWLTLALRSFSRRKELDELMQSVGRQFDLPEDSLPDWSRVIDNSSEPLEEEAEDSAAQWESEIREQLIEAIRLTQEFAQLPALPGWSWYDALKTHAPDVLADMMMSHRKSEPLEETALPYDIKQYGAVPQTVICGNCEKEIAILEPGATATALVCPNCSSKPVTLVGRLEEPEGEERYKAGDRVRRTKGDIGSGVLMREEHGLGYPAWAVERVDGKVAIWTEDCFEPDPEPPAQPHKTLREKERCPICNRSWGHFVKCFEPEQALKKKLYDCFTVEPGGGISYTERALKVFREHYDSKRDEIIELISSGGIAHREDDLIRILFGDNR